MTDYEFLLDSSHETHRTFNACFKLSCKVDLSVDDYSRSTRVIERKE